MINSTANLEIFAHSEDMSQGGSVKHQLELMELPAARLSRLQLELDDLEAELQLLERDERQSYLFG